MAFVFVEELNKININNELCQKILNQPKREESLKAWSYLNELLYEFQIDLYSEEITYNEYGKPYIKNKKIYFNISHSKDLVAIIISDYECAIDIQYVDENKDYSKYINKLLTSKELMIYEKEKNKNDYFYKVWTQKEALYKYKGTGIILTNLSKINEDIKVETQLIKHKNNKYYLSFK